MSGGTVVGAGRTTAGHLCIDLSHVELTGNEQRELLRAVQETVIAFVAKAASTTRVVSISLGQDNGYKEDEEPPRQEPPPEQDPEQEPDEKAPPPDRP